MAPVIETIGINKTYLLGEVEVQALRGVTLRVERGEFVAVMGTSGSGKSTLMNIIGCLDRPTSGRYLLEGMDVAELAEEQLAAIRSRRIGFVFQTFNLLARTTALENVELPLFYSQWDSAGEQRARHLMATLGLAEREQNYPNQLSGGQQQRVVIARALINEPAILLADEPTGNLDSQSSAEIMEIISGLNHERRLTVLLVTHDPDVAAYADRVVTFRDGAIVSDQAKRERRPSGEAAEVGGKPAVPRPIPKEAGRGEVEKQGPGAWTFAAMAVNVAARALTRNKTRAALTMLGIFIGVAAVIAMVAVGDGARYSVQQQIRSLGTNLIVVVPGGTTSSGVHAGLGTTSTLTAADANAIKKDVPTVAAVSYSDRQVAQVVYANQNWSTSINGVTPAYLKIREWPVVEGRAFTEAEERAAAPVCLLGQTVVKNLFGGGQNPIGTTIRIKNYPLRVIGVLASKGQSNWGQDQDDVIVMPFTTAERKVLGTSQVAATVPTTTSGSTNPVINPYVSVQTTTAQNPVYQTNLAIISPFGAPLRISGVVNMIFVTARSARDVDKAMAQIQQLLHRRHRIGPGQDDDFTVRSLNEIAQASASASRVLTLLLATVASISLLVGGIGIMNIMLVSVTERTREIGIRIAVGARRLHILLQFLVESALLSVTGGIAGALLGIIASKVLSALAQWPTLVSPAAVMGGFAFAVVVGVFFGWYPARKAARLDPIEALRYE